MSPVGPDIPDESIDIFSVDPLQLASSDRKLLEHLCTPLAAEILTGSDGLVVVCEQNQETGMGRVAKWWEMDVEAEERGGGSVS